MQRTLILALLLTLSLPSFGQKIHFLDLTNKWTLRYLTRGSSGVIDKVYTRQFEKDSFFLGRTYYKIGFHWFREDTLTGHILHKTSSSFTDTTEELLYDYNWQVNDTIPQIGPFKYFVASVDSTQIKGIWYKVWHFASIGYVYYYNVIEGIGCTNGPFYPMDPNEHYPYSYQLICFESNNERSSLSIPVDSWRVHSSRPDKFDNASSCATDVNDLENNTGVSSVFPNPVDATSVISFQNKCSGTIVVYNSLGQTVINSTFEHKSELLIGDKIMVPGMYYYRVTDNNNGNSFSGKFVHL